MLLALACSLVAQSGFWLETLDLTKMSQGWNSPGLAKSVGGTPLTLNGQMYEHGIGTHSPSDFIVQLYRNAKSFTSDIGVDDETGKRGSVEFLVYLDGKKAYDSGIMHGGDPHKTVNLSLTRVKTLRLMVADGGDGIDYDHADWAGAQLTLLSDKRLPVAKSAPIEPAMKIYTVSNQKPELNGPRVVGCTPGLPFLFKIPASGQAPLNFVVTPLPTGLSLDAGKGILSGAVSQAGTFDMTVTVTGPKGTDHRRLRIIAGTHMLAQTPPMGWNSWNVWGTSVTADKVKAAADEITKQGLADYGYRDVNIDDAWEGQRDAEGNIQTNDKFGDMRALADYVHSLGLGLGIYSSPGPKTCAGYEASYQHEDQDARTYAQWGIDYLKYDWCSYGGIAPNPDLGQLQAPYKKMRESLDKSGRDIVFSLCQYGMGDVYKWGKDVGGNLWRTTGDINDSWGSLSSIAFAHSEKASGAGPGGWNDPDMLVVGNLGWGDHPHPTHLTPNEQITHITMWALLAAPLLLGCDLTHLDPWTKSLITNHDVIDVDQDPLGKAATRVFAIHEGEVWSRPLFDGTLAVGFMNRGLDKQRITVSWARLGLSVSQPVRDLWERRDLGLKSGSFAVVVPSHGARLFKIGTARS